MDPFWDILEENGTHVYIEFLWKKQPIWSDTSPFVLICDYPPAPGMKYWTISMSKDSIKVLLNFRITVRRHISESQLSEIAYYPAMKIWDVIDESRLFVAIF